MSIGWLLLRVTMPAVGHFRAAIALIYLQFGFKTSIISDLLPRVSHILVI